MSSHSHKGLKGVSGTPSKKNARGENAIVEQTEYSFSRAEVAAYLIQISNELATLARSKSFDSVAYFLEMARIEASIIEKNEFQNEE